MWVLRTFGGSIVGVFLFWTLFLLNLWLDFIPKWEPYEYRDEPYSSYDDSSYSTTSYQDSYSAPGDSYSSASDPYGASSGSSDPYGSTPSDSSLYSDPYSSPYEGQKMDDFPGTAEEMAPDAPAASGVREQLALLDADISEDYTGAVYKITVRSLVFNTDLATISQAGSLQELTLEQPQYIDDEGLRSLSGLTQLRSLSLRYANVTDSGLYHLDGLTNLTSVDLTGTQVTFDGVTRLRSVLPGCNVIY